MHNVCYHDPPAPSSIDARRSWPQYDAVVARALEKLPDSRYPSAAEFRSAILAEYAQPLHSTLSDATIIPATRKATSGGSPSQAQGTPAPGGSAAGSAPPAAATSTPTAGATSTPPPTGWSAPVLAGVEMTLARFVGPVARALVRRAAKTCKDIPSLTVALLPSIEQPEDQDAFVHAVTGGPVAALRTRIGMDQTLAGALPSDAAPAVTGVDPPLTPAELDHATRVLTQYIGPIARVVTKRAAAGGASRRQFLHQVAQTLDTDAKRERFLREATIPGI